MKTDFLCYIKSDLNTVIRRDVKGLYFREQISYEGAVIELSIIDFSEWIKKLLSMSKSLDSYVNFSVYESGRSLVTVKIYQYQMSLQQKSLNHHHIKVQVGMVIQVFEECLQHGW